MPKSNFPRILHTVPNPLESDQFQLRIFESFADPLAVYDRGFHILKVNQPLMTFYQRSAAELLGRHCFEVFHGRDTMCEGCHVAQVFETGKPQRREMHITLKPKHHLPLWNPRHKIGMHRLRSAGLQIHSLKIMGSIHSSIPKTIIFPRSGWTWIQVPTLLHATISKMDW